VVFGNGAWIAAGDANALIRRQKSGSMLMGYSHIALADGQTRQGFNDDLRNSDFVFKYGQQVQPNTYIGIGFRVRDMMLDYGDLYLSLPRRTRNESIAGSFTLGGLWHANQKLTLGVMSETGWIHSDIKGALQLPVSASVPFKMDLTTQTLNVKAGMRWKLRPALTVYGDGQFYHLGNSLTGIQVGRFYFGGDLRVAPGILLIGGASVDTLSQVSESAGISIALSKPRLIKVTYQRNPLPEIRQEFGSGNLLSATMVFGF
jgi:hypothetical protein